MKNRRVKYILMEMGNLLLRYIFLIASSVGLISILNRENRIFNIVLVYLIYGRLAIFFYDFLKILKVKRRYLLIPLITYTVVFVVSKIGLVTLDQKIIIITTLYNNILVYGYMFLKKRDNIV